MSETSTAESNPLFFRYWIRTIVVTGVLLGLAAGFNWLVDPYLYFGSPRFTGFNQAKPAAISQVRMAKAYLVERSDFDTVFLGNSRVDIGLDPESNQLPAPLKPAFNLGQPGGGSRLALRYLDHAMSVQSPRTVVLGVDFLNFLTKPDQIDPVEKQDNSVLPTSPDLQRLHSTGVDSTSWKREQQVFADGLASTWSLSTLTDSVATVWAQRDLYSANITESGFNTGDAFRTLIRREGQAALFHQKNVEYAEKFRTRVAPVSAESAEFAAIESVLALCRTHGVRLEVFIHPYHADVLELIDATGHWHSFEAWKRELTSLCESHDARLWDFSGYNMFTTEIPPQQGDRKSLMNWYWESGHYRSTLGDEILRAIFHTTRAPSDFGRRLTKSSLPTWLAEARNAAAAYRRSYPQRVKSIRELIVRPDVK